MVGKKSLRDNQLFHDLTEEEYDVVSGILKRKVYQPEETIFEEGGTDQILYIIKKGEVRICKQGPHGGLQTITLLKDRDIYGEMSFFDGTPHSATVVTARVTEAFLLKMKDFEKLIDTHPRLVFKVMKNIFITVHGIVRGMNERYVDMLGYMFGRNR